MACGHPGCTKPPAYIFGLQPHEKGHELMYRCDDHKGDLPSEVKVVVDIAWVEAMITRLIELKRKHDYCEDPYYSCPLNTSDGNEIEEGAKCNCGADRDNAIIDKMITELTALVPNLEGYHGRRKEINFGCPEAL
jgi:hypothetical protein